MDPSEPSERAAPNPKSGALPRILPRRPRHDKARQQISLSKTTISTFDLLVKEDRREKAVPIRARVSLIKAKGDKGGGKQGGGRSTRPKGDGTRSPVTRR